MTYAVSFLDADNGVLLDAQYEADDLADLLDQIQATLSTDDGLRATAVHICTESNDVIETD